MLYPMTRRLLRRGLAGTLMLLLGVMLFQFINPFIADSLGGAEGLEGLVNQLPPAMQQLAQMSPDFLAMTGLAGYLSRGYDHPVYFILSISAMVGFAGRAIAGEVDSGVLALALSRPISRLNIYLARVIGVVVLCVLFGSAGPVATALGIQVAAPVGEVSGSQLAAMALLGMLFTWAIGGLALMVSAFSNSTGRVVGWATGYLVIAYFVDVFAELWSALEPIRPLSLFDYFETSPTMVDGRVPTESALVFAGVGLAAVVAGWLVFRRRDFMV
jgi:ABC-type transport system involved in multi-copper enzyme maturation permease subunit